MNPHALIFTAATFALAGLLAVAFAPADWAALRRILEHWRARRAARAAYAIGADLTAGLAALTGEQPVIVAPPWRTAPAATGHRHLIPGRQPTCPGCGGRRCRSAREGRDCRWDGEHEPTAYAAGRPLPRPGRHDVWVIAAAWRRRHRLAWLRLAVTLDPTTYAHRLGRAVQLGNGHVIGAGAA